MKRRASLALLLVAITASIFLSTARAQGTKADYERAAAVRSRSQNSLLREIDEIYWDDDSRSFCYKVRCAADAWEFVAVDVLRQKRCSAFDHARLAAELDKATGDAFDPRRLPLSDIRRASSDCFSFAVGGKRFCFDAEGTVTAAPALAASSTSNESVAARAADLSPDEAYRAVLRGANFKVERIRDQKVLLETSDGTEERPYSPHVCWSADSRRVAAVRISKVPRRKVTVVEAARNGGEQSQVHVFDYLKPGDALPKPSLTIIDLETPSVLAVDDKLFANPFTESGQLVGGWTPNGAEYRFEYNQRGHDVYRLLGVDGRTGAIRVIVEERSATFIDYNTALWRRTLYDVDELLWTSERGGWRHLYRYDAKRGTLLNQITHGAWVVRDIIHVDESRRRIWFMASGLHASENPYQRHLCRADFNGGGFAQLTSGDGDHDVRFSPDRQVFVDIWSRPDLPPRAELRRAIDGALLLMLEQADWSTLVDALWRPPLRFVAKGRDSRTDIHGLIYTPSNFDPAKRYPVVEQVYAGPQAAYTPASFQPNAVPHAIAELGFIVVQADGMGTNYRGKQFHDVCWKNLADAGFEDRIAWIKAAARQRPWMDLSRVGIYGGSAGGQNAVRALLDHHDFYHVAVADCGCHDNRMDKIWWNEQWLGWPVGEAYTHSSNVVDAAKLEGKLLLIVGEVDRNVDPASTTQLAAALQKADKDFDLQIIAGAGHGAAETPYGSRLRMDYLVRNLLGVEPRR